MAPGSPLTRWLRALLLSVVGVVFGVMGHTLAGGQIGWSGLLFAVVACTVLSASILERQVSGCRIFLLLLLGQVIAHWMMGGTGHHGIAHQGHGGDQGVAELAGGGSSGQMLLAHLLATLAMTLWLREAERALWSILALLGARLVTVVLPRVQVSKVLVRPIQPRPTFRVRVFAVRSAIIAATLPRRGPPQLQAVTV